MKVDIETLLKNIENYVQVIFEQADTSKLLYHNYEHTVSVVRHVVEITGHYPLTREQRFAVLAAAWFHDTGHLYAEWSQHEEKSVVIANFFLFDKDVPEDLQASIDACIMATKMPVHPANLLEQIICDADTYHLGTGEFLPRNELVWDEIEARLGIKIDDRIAKSINFLKAHQFYTDYCQQLLQAGKERNIKQLKAAL
jgi:predicted metal-dependent HD superfamily phosphohydrolase